MPEHSMIYTHRHFSFGYNGDQIVEVNMTASDPQLVEAGMYSCLLRAVTPRPIMFSYSYTWKPSNITFHQRFNRYFQYNKAESQIHWFSVFNSFMIVVVLAGLVTLIMSRVLNLDYIRYSQSSTDLTNTTNIDDSGWKRVHGDVFRPCDHYFLYCLLLGNGAHLTFAVIVSLTVILLIRNYIGRSGWRAAGRRRPRDDHLLRRVRPRLRRQRLRVGQPLPPGLLPAHDAAVDAAAPPVRVGVPQ